MKSDRLFTLALAAILAAAIPARGLNIPPTLRDELTGAEISEGTRNLVICIHGWNNPPNNDRYTEYEWAALVAELKLALPKTGSDPWALLLYHWEHDAATGLIDWFDPLNENPVANANEAAAFAWSHGNSLGPRLPSSVRRIHIIAHSAGAWAARETALTLLQNNSFVVVQITLLDPYVPDSILPHPYTVSKVNDLALADFLYAGRISLLENYYADDSLVSGWNSMQTPAPTLGTQNTFSWRARDINQEVDWGSIVVAPLGARSPFYLANYDWHSGPIYFYADTLSASAGYPPASLPTGSPYDYHQRGWYRSLYYRTQQGQLPQITVQPVGQTSTGSDVTLSVATSGSAPFSFQWYKDKSLIIGANNSNYTVNTSTDPPTPYVVRITDANGNQIFSDRAVVTFYSSPPPPPTAPSIASVLPPTLIGLPLPQTQLLRIIGSGFTATSTLLFNGSIASDPACLHYSSANEIDYDIRTDTTAADWTVQVVNGEQKSNLGYFTVVNPPPNTGSLTVNLSPSGAVSTGAQWRVDGGSYHNNGDVVSSLSPGPHTLSFKAVSGYNTPANQSTSILANQQATANASYTPITSSGQTLSVSTTTMAVGSGTGGGSFLVQSGGSGTLNWSANTSDAWLNILIPSGTISGQGGQNRLDFSFSENPSAGPRTGTITITANGASGSPQAVTITQAGMNNSFYVVAISAQDGTVIKNPNFPAYPSGGVVELTAVPDSGYEFKGWSGDITDNQNPIGVLMDGNKNITANIGKIYYSLTVSAQHGVVTKDPNFSGFRPGTVVVLTAMPDTGYQFIGWSGDITDSQNPIGVPIIDTEKNIIANFSRDGKLMQTISFGALSRQVFGDAPFALSASASSGLPVSFSVITGPGVLSSNIMTMTGSGLVVVRASQAGDATYSPAPNVDQVLSIVPGINVISDFQRLGNGMFTLRFYGEPEANYVVQASTNLVNWLPLTTNQISELGYLEYTDASSTNYDRRFYRIAP